MRFLCLLLLLGFFQNANAAAPTSTSTEDNAILTATGKKAMIVAKGAAFGLGGGLVVGLASQVFKKNSRNIFLFGSLGMYAGIGMGLYIVMAPRGSMPYEGPDTYEDFSSASREKIIVPESGLLASSFDTKNLKIEVPLYTVNF